MKYGIPFPPELALSREIPPAGKVLYMVALVARPTSVSELAEAAGFNDGHVSRLCARMAAQGWMRLKRNGKQVMPIPLVPYDIESRRAHAISGVASVSRYKGEFLMKCWLDLLVASTNLVDNVRPEFLRSPLTEEPLEIDRLYLDGVAFEFNGDQHYGPTREFSGEKGFKRVRTRDLLKKGLTQEKSIILVEVRKYDLSLEGMRKKIPGVLPVCAVDEESPYVKALSRMSEEYREKAEGADFGNG